VEKELSYEEFDKEEEMLYYILLATRSVAGTLRRL
jgi:hypothetical protein